MANFRIFHILSCESYNVSLDTDLKTCKEIFNLLMIKYLVTPLDEEVSDLTKENLWKDEVIKSFGNITNLHDFAGELVDFLTCFVVEENLTDSWLSLTINEFEITEII
jgi:hypothetical protein